MSINFLPQQNNSVESIPQYQDWGPFPNLTNINFFLSGGALYPLVLPIRLKDVIGVPGMEIYSAFRLQFQKEYINHPGTWLTSTAPGINPPNPTPIIENGVIKNFTLSFTIGTLPPGQYEVQMKFFITGLASNGVWMEVSRYVHRIVLNIYETNTVIWSPSSINLTHYQNAPSPQIPIEISGPNWRIVGRPNYILSSDDPDVIIEEIQTSEGSYFSASGSGIKILKLSLSNFFDTASAVNSPQLSSFLNITSGGSFLGQIPITVILENEAQFETSTRTLNFSAIKGISEPESQFVHVMSIEPFSFTSSPWMIVELSEDIYPGINVVPIATVNMESGNYSGEIVLSSTVNGLPSEIRIQVNYDLSGFASIPYSPGKVNFTLDKKFIEFSSADDQTYVRLLMTAKTYDLQDVATVIELSFHIPLIKRRQEFNIGKIIHRLMYKIKSFTQSGHQNKMAEVTLNIKEHRLMDNELIQEIQTENYFFVAGLSPEGFNGIGVLSVQNRTKRFTNGGIARTNVIATSSFVVETLKNGDIVDSIMVDPGGKVYSHELLLNNFNQGDNIEIKFTDSQGNSDSQDLVLFPANEESTLIYWLDEFLVLSSMEFTGKFSVKNDFESKTQLLHKRLVDILESRENSKTSKLNINTGWLQRGDIADVESLMRSEKAWWDYDGRKIEIIPIPKSITTMNSDQELVSFELEFQINRNYNEEVFTR